MADKELIVRVCHAYATSAQWSNANPVLMSGEMGVESDTQKYKIGDGVTRWSNLSYASGVPIDTTLSASSTNPVQNKVIKAALDTKVNKTDKVYEADLEWGGRNIVDGYSPIDSAIVPFLGANRFAFAHADGITVEYSTDAGETWLDYGLSNYEKVVLLTTPNQQIYIGKATDNPLTPASMLRVIINTQKIGLYTRLNKFIMQIATNGCKNCYCTIDASLKSTPETFKVFADKARLSGWSGWNVINTEGLITYSNDANRQYAVIRFTFGCTEVNTNFKGLGVYCIFGFGGVGWQTPSNMAQEGHLYTYNGLQEAEFPATVTAPNFIGKVNGYTISASVPANAKFTDTVYTHPATHPASMITGLSTVATSGSYNDLSDKPLIPATVIVDDTLDANSTNAVQNKVVYNLGYKFFSRLNALADVARTGSYSDLTGTPGNATATAAGLMSAADKAKLDKVDADVGSVKMIVYS